MLELLQPLDYPRQALANLIRGGSRAISGEATTDDYLGMLPGVAGAVGLATGLSPLMAALAAGVGQAAGKATGMAGFEAPTAADVVGSVGGDPESWWQNIAAQVATDPLTFAPMMGMAGRMARRPKLHPRMRPEDVPLVPPTGGLRLPGEVDPLAVPPGGSAEALRSRQWVSPGQAPGEAAHAAAWQGSLEDQAALQQALEAHRAEVAARDAYLAQPLPPVRGVPGGPGPMSADDLYRVHADMVAEGLPFEDRLPLLGELRRATARPWVRRGDVPEGALGGLAGAQGIREDLQAAHLLLNAGYENDLPMLLSANPEMLREFTHGTVQLPGGESIPSLFDMMVWSLQKSDDVLRPGFLLEKEIPRSDRFGTIIADSLYRPVPPDELAGAINTAGSRGIRVNRGAFGDAYVDKLRAPLGSMLDEMSRSMMPGSRISQGRLADTYWDIAGLLGQENIGLARRLVAEATKRRVPGGGGIELGDLGMPTMLTDPAQSPLLAEMLQLIRGRAGL